MPPLPPTPLSDTKLSSPMTFSDMLRLLENDVRRSEVDDASVSPGT
jgi:hypothetical protein